MAYLNVIPEAQAVPAVRGLGAVRFTLPKGFGQIASSCAQYLDQQFALLPSPSEAAMLLNTPSPSGAVLSALYINGAGSPDQAAQVVYQLAQEYCGQQGFQTVFGGTPAADCNDGGQAAAAAAYPKWLAYYQSLPSSVWTTGTVSPQVANPLVFPAAPPQPAPVTAPVPAPVQSQPQIGSGVNQLPGPNMTPAVAVTPAASPEPTPTPSATPVVQPIALQLPSFLTNTIALGGLNVPVWGLIAAAAGLLFLLPRGR